MVSGNLVHERQRIKVQIVGLRVWGKNAGARTSAAITGSRARRGASVWSAASVPAVLGSTPVGGTAAGSSAPSTSIQPLASTLLLTASVRGACSLFAAHCSVCPSQAELVRLQHWGLVLNEVCQVTPGFWPRSSSAMLSPALLTYPLRDILSPPLIDRPARLHINAQYPLFRYGRRDNNTDILFPFMMGEWKDRVGKRGNQVKYNWGKRIAWKNNAQNYFGGKILQILTNVCC